MLQVSRVQHKLSQNFLTFIITSNTELAMEEATDHKFQRNFLFWICIFKIRVRKCTPERRKKNYLDHYFYHKMMLR